MLPKRDSCREQSRYVYIELRRRARALTRRRSRKTAGGLPTAFARSDDAFLKRVAMADLAVIGCHSLEAMDVGGQKRSWADVSGRPPAVLKTASLSSATSTNVRLRSVATVANPPASTIVHQDPLAWLVETH